MDLTTLISSIITGAFAIMVCIINNNANMKKRDIEQEKSLAVIETKITELTRETREHNSFATRMPALETRINALEKRIDYIDKR